MRKEVVLLFAQQTWNGAVKSRAVMILLLALGCLLAYGAFSGIKIFHDQQSARLVYEKQVRENWENMPDKHPHRMAHYGYIAFRPKHTLSFFDFGIESYTGKAVFLEAHKQNTVNFSEAGFSTGILRFGEISMATVLQILVPLLIFFLGFKTVASERENSTLKILLSQGAQWKEILAGKSLGLMGVVMLLFIPAILMAFGFWLFRTRFHASTDDLLRILWIFFFYTLYFGTLCTIAVLVSAASQTSKTALVSLTGIWLLFCIVLPRVSQAMGSTIYPSPSKTAFESGIEKELIETGDSHNPDDPYFKNLKDSLLQVYKVKTIEELPINYSGFQMKEGERLSSEIYNKHMAGLLDTYQAQNSISRLTAFVNPYMAIKNISMALCGTDFHSYSLFRQQAEDYRYYLAQQMNELQIKYISNKKTGEDGKALIISSQHWKDIPQFKFKSPENQKMLKNELPSILALMGWAAGLPLLVIAMSKRLKAV